MRSEEKIEKKPNKKKRFVKIFLGILLALALFTGGFIGYYGSQVISFLEGISEPDTEIEVEDEDSERLSRDLNAAKPFAAIILGTDIEEDGDARSDTIIVMTVNPQKRSMKLVSIPRDTLVYLPPPHDTIEKINAAFTFGGPRLTKDMISEMFDIPIEFYATMDFRGLVELVDAVGGITVDSDFAFTESNFVDSSQPIQIQEGIQTLNGAEALGYARMRKQDPRGDFGRQERQREVVLEILDEIASFETASNLTNILNAVQPYLRTNASSNQMLAIARRYTSALNHIETLPLDGLEGSEYFPHYELTVWVWEPYDYSLAEVSETLKEHLGLVDISQKYDNYPLQNGELEELPRSGEMDEVLETSY